MGAEEPTPKDRSTSLDLRAVVHEARLLLGSRLDKAFDLVPRGLGLSLRGRGAGRSELWIVPGLFAAVAPTGLEHAEGLSTMAREVRRLATGATLKDVAEPAGERYLELQFTRASDPAPITLASELFGAGNLLLVRDGTIAAVERARRWAHRDLRAGAAYARPPNRTDPFAATPAELEAELARSRTDLASTLAARLGLGGPVAEEAIARGGWSGSEAAAPTAHRLAEPLHGILRQLLEEVGDRPKGFLVLREGQPVDASPYVPRRWDGVSGVAVEQRPTFSEAALAYFPTLQLRPPSAEETRRTEEREALERQLGRQQAAVDALADATAQAKADGERVFAHFPEVEAAVAEAGQQRPRPSRLTLDLGGRSVDLPFAANARRVAQLRYEEAKELGVKLAGARAALAAALERSTELARKPSVPRPLASRAAARTGAPRWFEKFRWFVTSEGALVLGGRDAASNDLLVRRHLKASDLYFHADIHGAASVVLKRASVGDEITERSFREAAQWAVAFSKAWRGGLASATAFWANPDQVSKSASSGEFVARGAWVVRGTKHFVPDVPLELAVGSLSYEGAERWSAAPPEALRARGSVRFVLRPGDERDRASREIELARELGVSRSLLQGLLPAGGLEILRA